jgi:hypothetical protein
MLFYGEGSLAPRPTPLAGGPPLVGCQRLLIQYSRRYIPYLVAVSSIRTLRTRCTLLTNDPLNMEKYFYTTTTLISRFGLLRSFVIDADYVRGSLHPVDICPWGGGCRVRVNMSSRQRLFPSGHPSKCSLSKCCLTSAAFDLPYSSWEVALLLFLGLLFKARVFRNYIMVLKFCLSVLNF